MSVRPSEERLADAPALDAAPRAWWPLLISLVGLLTTAALLLENRPDGSGDFDYPVTAEDVVELGHVAFRVSGLLGYVAALSMLVLAAVWHQRVGRRFPWSTGASVVTFSLVASASLMTLAYGWRGALGNYLPTGMEGDSYDAEGLYTYFVMNDFSPYIAGVPLLGAGFALAWMSFADGLVSRPLGVAAGLVSALLLLAVAVSGVPGLPAAMSVAMVVAGVWLTLGRSQVTG
ncbi:hypothetical protein [Aeromicrobium sp. IC_218]|uniref:hypothetical protein n=1 Tax=Aeromicrobium sp. IC_218 TaxID=2545468 RepID=UPI0010397888|nr:hypothetical protein [Aeromicrobium sp. IC_218]TCI97458.1 hypothetical protein E0W78_11715 [Aeromicrobium sp. IC_218]